MTYDAREKSAYSGRPIETYEFTRNVNYYRYTSAAKIVVLSSKTYSPISISRTAIDQGQELNRSGIVISVPRDNPVAELFIAYPPGDVVTVVIRRYHEGDGEANTIWWGRVISVVWKGSEAQMTCESSFTSLKRIGLRRQYQSQCPHALYQAECGADKNNFRVYGSLTGVTGATVTMPAASGQDDGYFDGGYLIWDASGLGVESRIILTHTGSTLTLSSPIQGLTTGQFIDIYPGCNRTLAQCDSRFSNTLGYGGFPYMPPKNPFDTTIY